jgi:hypothetical protein
MARDVIERELTGTRAGHLRCAVAPADDNADIRRLLRENPTPGQISISLEREPDYFADAHIPGATKQTIIARDDRRVVCAGSCTIRQRFVNGRAARVGYLGGLRLAGSHAGRFDILRHGYEFFHQHQAESPADYYFTSIAADNVRARTLLERGLPGMPLYEFTGGYVTVLISARRAGSVPKAVANMIPSAEEIVEFLNHHNGAHQFAPCWSEDELAALQSLGLQPNNFGFIRDGRSIRGSAALWDQRGFKQTVVRGYASSLARARPVLNVVARFANETRLPAVGETLSNAFVSHLAAEPNLPELLTGLIAELCGAAARRGIELLTLGFVADDPRLAVLRRNFRCREYHSRLYVVRWPGCGGAARELDGRVLAPEVALL